MFEEIKNHRQAVQEQIQKGFEIGFTGNEIEKAHKVGDVHPNGKWVWTQLPSGKYDWRVIKKNAASGGSAPHPTAQSNEKEKREISLNGETYHIWKEGGDYKGSFEDPKNRITDANKINKFSSSQGFDSIDDVVEYVEKYFSHSPKSTAQSSNAAKQKTAQSGEDLISRVPGLKNLKEYLTTFNSKYTDFDKVSLSKTPKGNWDVRYDGHRLGILNGDQIPESTVKKMGFNVSLEEKEKKRKESIEAEKKKREKLVAELDAEAKKKSE